MISSLNVFSINPPLIVLESPVSYYFHNIIKLHFLLILHLFQGKPLEYYLLGNLAVSWLNETARIYILTVSRDKEAYQCARIQISF